MSQQCVSNRRKNYTRCGKKILASQPFESDDAAVVTCRKCTFGKNVDSWVIDATDSRCDKLRHIG
jgi:uncharacterized protein YchJ